MAQAAAARNHPGASDGAGADRAGEPVRQVLHPRQPAQPGPADDRGGADRGLDDLRHHHRRHRSLASAPSSALSPSCLACSGRIWACRCRSPSVLGLAVGDAGGAGQRADHHPLPGAAADCHAGHAGALSRPCGRHQPRPARCAAIPIGSSCLARATARRSDAALDPGRRSLWSAAIVLGAAPSGAAAIYAIGHNETRRAFPACRSIAIKLCDLCRLGLLPQRLPPSSSSPASPPPGRTWAPASSSTPSPPSSWAAPRSSAAAASIIGTVLGLILIQALKNGLSLSGVKGDGTIVRDRRGADTHHSAFQPVSPERQPTEKQPAYRAMPSKTARVHHRRKNYACDDFTSRACHARRCRRAWFRHSRAWTGGDDLPTNPLACDATPATAGCQALRWRRDHQRARPQGQAASPSSTSRSSSASATSTPRPRASPKPPPNWAT